MARGVRQRVRASVPLQEQQDITFTGDYASWADAERHSQGYAAPVILERTRTALLKVRSGEAQFERDSVLFDRPDYPLSLIAGLLRSAARAGGRLAVLDFGGSLGSSYFQVRHFIPGTIPIEWSIVEQPAHVICGREYFEDKELRFYETVEDCLSHHDPDTLLLSSVLQYLPDPRETLARLLRLGLRNLILDRTGFLDGDRERLTVQTVPERIYPASYPAWFFNETILTALITGSGYDLVADFRRMDHDHRLPPAERAYYKGFIYEKTARL